MAFVQKDPRGNVTEIHVTREELVKLRAMTNDPVADLFARVPVYIIPEEMPQPRKLTWLDRLWNWTMRLIHKEKK